MEKIKFHFKVSWPEAIIEAAIFLLPLAAAFSFVLSIMQTHEISIVQFILVLACMGLGAFLSHIVFQRGERDRKN